jgi:dephospho-CoA kinase
MLIIGLTGSIGMGKSVTAMLFAQAGVWVHDADAAVHRLYGGEAAALIEAAFPHTTTPAGVDRNVLARRVTADVEALAKLEAIVHPLVRDAEAQFLAAAARSGARTVVLDIPLLFETGSQVRVDVVVVVGASPEVQRARVLSRPGMTEPKLKTILAKQMPDVDKRRRAHFVVDSSQGIDSARNQVHGILRAVAALPGRRGLGYLENGELRGARDRARHRDDRP